MIKIIIWNEYIHEIENEEVKSIYPDGIHNCIKDFLSNDESLKIETATLREKGNGISEEKLKDCNVLIWWGHKAHNEVLDSTVNLVQRRVLEGMGLIVLHSGHFSKIFKQLMGTNCNLTWREYGEKERLWICNPCHPICEGLDPYFELEMEMRRSANMPPYRRLAAIIYSSLNELALADYVKTLANHKPQFEDIQIFGPAPAPIYQIKGRYRVRFLINASKQVNIQKIIQGWNASITMPSSIRKQIDIDPYNFM